MTRRLTDLRLVVGVLFGAVVTLLVPGVPTPIEWAFGIPLLLLVPGYVTVAALFPSAPDQSSSDDSGGVGWPVRVALALIVSTLLVAGVGFVLAALGVLTLASSLGLISVLTIAGLWLARERRRARPAAERAAPLSNASLGTITNGIGTSGVQTVVLAVAAFVLVASLTFAAVTPAPSASYSEASLSFQPSDGSGTSDPGPATLVEGDEETISLTLANHEGAATTYTITVVLQRLGPNGTVSEQERLDEVTTRLPANESRTLERTVTPSMRGTRMRLRVLVFETDTTGPPDLTLRRWVDVVEDDSR